MRGGSAVNDCLMAELLARLYNDCLVARLYNDFLAAQLYMTVWWLGCIMTAWWLSCKWLPDGSAVNDCLVAQL